MFKNSIPFEPKMFGTDSLIFNAKDAINIIDKNSYYTYLYSFITIILATLQLLLVFENTDLSINAYVSIFYGFIYLILAFCIKKYRYRICIIIFSLLILDSLIYEFLGDSSSMVLLLNTFTLMALYRIWKSISFILYESPLKI